MDTELPVLTGFLNIPAQSGFSLNRISKKKPSHRYCLLFQSSKHGIERLEICDSKDDKSPKIVTLENCVKITHEPSPSNLIQIVKKTGTLTLNALTDEDLKEWLNNLQSVAFRDKNLVHVSNIAIEQDNDLYCSSFGDGMFIVTLIPSDASMRCNIEPKLYVLHLTTTELQLKSVEDSTIVIAKWPYRFIRKYGYRDGKLTFEAGRKCFTGEGVFTLNHTNPQEIFRCMSAKMKSMKKLISGDCLNNIDSNSANENIFSAAAGMEAGSRSPLPPSTQPTGDFMEVNSMQSCSSLRSFLSPLHDSFGSSIVNSVASSSTSSSSPTAATRSMPVSATKHIPNKPPRKPLLQACTSDGGASTPTSASNVAVNIPLSSPSAENEHKSLNAADKFSNYETVAITTSSSNNPQKCTGSTVILNTSSPPELLHNNKQLKNLTIPPVLPVRNERGTITTTTGNNSSNHDRDYESIQTITNAWKTLGVDDVRHTERIQSCIDSVDFTIQRAVGSREKLLKDNQLSVRKIVDIDIEEPPTSSSSQSANNNNINNNNNCSDGNKYDRLDFLSPNNNNFSVYKTVVAVSSVQPINQRQRCDSPNDYELIASPDAPQPSSTSSSLSLSCRANIDHSINNNCGPGLRQGKNIISVRSLPSPSTTTTTTTTKTTTSTIMKNSKMITTPLLYADKDVIKQQAQTTLVGSATTDIDLEHLSCNGLKYTIVSKPKRI